MESGRYVVYRGGQGELTEKKSRFIATVFPVHTEEEVQDMLEKIRKKYWDARHNCSAFVLGDNQEITRCSDDGEPGGTAGKPMLEVLLGQNLTNVCVVVTRYFGGVLLGTGGLVRAYSGAVKEGLKNCEILKAVSGSEICITTSYTMSGKVQYLAAGEGLIQADIRYSDQVEMIYYAEQEQLRRFSARLTDATGGQVEFEKIRDISFGMADGKAVILSEA